ncbi:MAG: acetyl-CoA carboxylase biotin carboxyl carrier protein subunit [Gemmatimonadales bacterium]
MKYFVTIAGRELTVDLDGDHATVDGTSIPVQLLRVPGAPEFRLTIDGRSHTLAIDGFDDGVWRLLDRGAVRDVGIEDERSRHIRSLAGAGKSATSGGVLKAPMPGLVVRIAVSEGDVVAAGTGLVVLEAMKMENELKAPAAGTVRGIRVTAGQAVEKGQVLLELAP